MSTITQIEDLLLTTIQGLGIFRLVDSLGRGERPTALIYPSAFVYFAREEDTGERPRPIVRLEYEVLVVNQNVKSEKAAAQNTYTLIDQVRDAINGKTLGLTDIEPWHCVAREMVDFSDGVIWYLLQFRTRQYLAVPIE